MHERRTAQQMAQDYIEAGYARVNDQWRSVARIDREDWRDFFAPVGAVPLRTIADTYRRQCSKDVIDGLSAGVYELIPSSDDAPYQFREKAEVR